MNSIMLENNPIPVIKTEVLWRYVNISALLLNLDGQLRFSSVQDMRRIDPNEGLPQWDDVTQTEAFTNDEYRELQEYVKKYHLSEQEQQLFEDNARHPGANQKVIFGHWRRLLASTRYVLCFLSSKHESIAMWRLFAPKGFAIRTSLNSLEKALEPTGRAWRISHMKYWDKSREITPDDTAVNAQLRQSLRYPYLLKGIEYEYEKEVRLCTVDASAQSSLIVNSIPPESWIDEIRISPEVWHEDAKLLQVLIQERAPKLKNRVTISPLGSCPDIADSDWAKLEAGVNQKNAEDNWPAFLSVP